MSAVVSEDASGVRVHAVILVDLEERPRENHHMGHPQIWCF